MRYWIFKTEPGCFSLADLEASPDRITAWDGVRNYQARNFMRDDMRRGDLGLFYHSGKTPEVAGGVEIVQEGYPDHTAQDAFAQHFDPAATPDHPRWYMVDVRLVRSFVPPVPRALLRRPPDLAGVYPYCPAKNAIFAPFWRWPTVWRRNRRVGRPLDGILRAPPKRGPASRDLGEETRAFLLGITGDG